MNKPIRVFKFDLSFLYSEIDTYQSLIFERGYYKPGSFTLVINKHLQYADTLQKGRLIMLGADEEKVGIITYKGVELDERGKVTENWKIRGKELSGVLGRRITIPPSGQAYDSMTNNAETIMHTYTNNNAVNPADADRKIDILNLVTDEQKGDSIFYQTRYKNLVDELEKISKISGLGWRIKLDLENEQWIFEVYEGKDLTTEQATNPPVIFSPDFDALSNLRFIDSDIDYKNVGYTAGQGEGANRDIEKVGAIEEEIEEKIEKTADWEQFHERENVEVVNDDLVLAQTEFIEAFTTTGSHTWTVPDGVEKVDVLVVAGGGGGGGGAYGGGGGAGGLLFKSGYSVTPSDNISVNIGVGGSAGEAQETDGGSGENSTFDGLTAIGGGWGSARDGSDSAGDGGSGGGSGYRGSSGGSALQPGSVDGGLGNDGGGQSDTGCGGGGAGEVGPLGDTGSPYGADGGDGVKEVNVDGTIYNLADIFGTDYGEIINGESWFAGGGAVGGNETGYDGGKGGGGDAESDGSAVAGAVNTGGGGAGGGYDGTNHLDGAAGGSGIVLIRYGSNEGYRISNSVDLGVIKEVTSSLIEWTSTEPTDTNIIIETAVTTDGESPPDSESEEWEEATDGGSIPGISVEDDLTGKYLWIKQTLTTTDGNETPVLDTLYAKIKGKAIGETFPEGLARREIFFDARDVETTENLKKRGEQRLSEHEQEFYLEGEILEKSSFKYETDYNLGDIVTVQNKDWNVTKNTRITKITEIYEEGQPFQLSAVFGNTVPNLIDKIKDTFGDVEEEVRR